MACVVTVRCARPASRSILSRICSRSFIKKKTSTMTRNVSPKVSTARVRPTVYRSELGEGPWSSISGAW